MLFQYFHYFSSSSLFLACYNILTISSLVSVEHCYLLTLPNRGCVCPTRISDHSHRIFVSASPRNFTFRFQYHRVATAHHHCNVRYAHFFPPNGRIGFFMNSPRISIAVVGTSTSFPPAFQLFFPYFCATFVIVCSYFSFRAACTHTERNAKKRQSEEYGTMEPMAMSGVSSPVNCTHPISTTSTVISKKNPKDLIICSKSEIPFTL